MIRFLLNDQQVQTDLPAGTVLLDYVRYSRNLTGTKIGCREGDCGACTVLVGELQQGVVRYRSMTSCLMPLSNVAGKHIVTVEGINQPSQSAGFELTNPVQLAMAEQGATQCGFCTPGFVMSLIGFALSAEPTQANAIAAIDGNICRCTGYKSIERAAQSIVSLLETVKMNGRLDFLIKNKIVPEYFTTTAEQLRQMQIERSNGLHIAANRIVAGGTDLYVQKHDEMVEAGATSVFDRQALREIRQESEHIHIGAAATVTDLKESPVFNQAFPSFQRYAKLVSSTPIRNMATIAGNFVNASPIGDLTIYFLALDATLVLADGEINREIPLRKFYTGYKTLDKKSSEVVQQIRIKIPAQGEKFHFEKVSKRTHLDIASVNSAILLRMEDDLIVKASVSAGGVGPVPLYLRQTSDFLTGKTYAATIVHEAIAIAKNEISPISDARGSKEYKTLLLGQLIRAHFMELFPSNSVLS